MKFIRMTRRIMNIIWKRVINFSDSLYASSTIGCSKHWELALYLIPENGGQTFMSREASGHTVDDKALRKVEMYASKGKMKMIWIT